MLYLKIYLFDKFTKENIMYVCTLTQKSQLFCGAKLSLVVPLAKRVRRTTTGK